MEFRSTKFIWALCTQLYSLAETPQLPPPPRIWAHIRGRYWSAKLDGMASLCDPMLEHTFKTSLKITHTCQLTETVCSFWVDNMTFSLFLIILFGLNVDVVLVEVAEAGQPQDPRTHPQPLPPHLLLLIKTGIHFILLAKLFCKLLVF